MNTAKITVIVPIYNAEGRLAACLDSITRQTYKNLEIILVNDGSTDGSAAIASSYEGADGRIRLLNKENGGAASARNYGLDIAEGDYVSFVDADDIIDLDMLEYLYGKAREHSSDIVQCATYFEEQNATRVLFSPSEDVVIDSPAKYGADKLCDLLSGGSCCKLFSRPLIETIRFDSSYPIGEDMRFNLDALSVSSRIALCTEPKYHYIQHESSVCNTAPTYERLTSYRRMLKSAEADFSDMPALMTLVLREHLRNDMHIASQIIRYSIDGCESLMSEIRRDVRLYKKRAVGIRLSFKERVKLRLISRLPWIYRLFVRNNRQSK